MPFKGSLTETRELLGALKKIVYHHRGFIDFPSRHINDFLPNIWPALIFDCPLTVDAYKLLLKETWENKQKILHYFQKAISTAK